MTALEEARRRRMPAPIAPLQGTLALSLHEPVAPPTLRTATVPTMSRGSTRSGASGSTNGRADSCSRLSTSWPANAVPRNWSAGCRRRSMRIWSDVPNSSAGR